MGAYCALDFLEKFRNPLVAATLAPIDALDAFLGSASTIIKGLFFSPKKLTSTLLMVCTCLLAVILSIDTDDGRPLVADDWRIKFDLFLLDDEMR